MSNSRANPLHPPLVSALLGAFLLLACDGQQYVSPDTVQLVITKDGSARELVNRCNYVPVLLGSTVEARYEVEDGLKATLTITHDAVTVGFDGVADAFKVSAADLADGAQFAPDPPAGYAVELSPGCTPDDP
jgi:hypothetical protein